MVEHLFDDDEDVDMASEQDDGAERDPDADDDDEHDPPSRTDDSGISEVDDNLDDDSASDEDQGAISKVVLSSTITSKKGKSLFKTTVEDEADEEGGEDVNAPEASNTRQRPRNCDLDTLTKGLAEDSERQFRVCISTENVFPNHQEEGFFTTRSWDTACEAMDVQVPMTRVVERLVSHAIISCMMLTIPIDPAASVRATLRLTISGSVGKPSTEVFPIFLSFFLILSHSHSFPLPPLFLFYQLGNCTATIRHLPANEVCCTSSFVFFPTPALSITAASQDFYISTLYSIVD